MNNIMTLVSKIILMIIKPIRVQQNSVSEVQGAFGTNTIGSKELVLLDEVITGQHKNNLNIACLDVKKAFDSVTHKYISAIIRNLPIPGAAVGIIERLYELPRQGYNCWEARRSFPLEISISKRVFFKGIRYHRFYLLSACSPSQSV